MNKAKNKKFTKHFTKNLFASQKIFTNPSPQNVVELTVYKYIINVTYYLT